LSPFFPASIFAVILSYSDILFLFRSNRKADIRSRFAACVQNTARSSVLHILNRFLIIRNFFCVCNTQFFFLPHPVKTFCAGSFSAQKDPEKIPRIF